MWQAITRDADGRLSTREGALGWLEEFAPELWVTVTNKSRTKSRKERVHGWSFGPSSWGRFRRGVEGIRAIASALGTPQPIPAWAVAVCDAFLLAHVPNRSYFPPAPRPAPIARARKEAPGAAVVAADPALSDFGFFKPVPEKRRQALRRDPPADPDPGLRPYFVRRGPGRNGAVVPSSANEGRFDSPDVLLAFAFATLLKPTVATPFWGRCPKCGRNTGNTPKGKPRVGLCGKCKMAAWRAENPEGSQQRRAAEKRTRDRKRVKRG